MIIYTDVRVQLIYTAKNTSPSLQPWRERQRADKQPQDFMAE
jgi:hypothetical protein